MGTFLYRLRKWWKYVVLKQGIKETGIIIPVLATKDGVIVDGMTRTRVAAELGLRVPTVVLPFDVEYKDPSELVDLLAGRQLNG